MNTEYRFGLRCCLIWLLFLITSCTHSHSYTSIDLADLPCESTQRFFYPLEFQKGGNLTYDEQIREIQQRLKKTRVSNLYIFVHGWDRPSRSAERDYQDFVCRFYRKSPRPMEDAIVIGIFWPATLFSNTEDPLLLKPLTFFPVKNRADEIGINGIPELLGKVDEVLNFKTRDVHVTFIGHSFGARILLRALERIPKELSYRILGVDLVLVNAASSPDSLKIFGNLRKNLIEEFLKPFPPVHFENGTYSMVTPSGERKVGSTDDFPLVAAPYEEEKDNLLIRLQKYNSVRVFNIFSSNDWSTRFLYPLATALVFESWGCALGGCPSRGYPIFTISSEGKIEEKWNSGGKETIFMVDGSRIISSHSDIYKRRLVNAIWQLLNNSE